MDGEWVFQKYRFMGFVIYGIGEKGINIAEFLIKCPSCEANNWADVVVVSKYYHIYWLPIFPIDKVANTICQKCGLRRYGLAFDNNLISNYYEIKVDFKNPWILYLGAEIMLLFFIGAVIAMIS